MQTTNIVPDSQTQLAYADYAHAEANVSRGVTSPLSRGSSMLLNISLTGQQRFKLVAFSDFTLVRQPYTLYPPSSEDFTVFVARFPSANGDIIK